MERTKRIPLTKGAFAIIDEDDFERVNQFKWTYNPRIGYAYKNLYPIIDGKKVRKILYMHRFILNAPDGIHVDHINHNGLDNKKINLRLCSHKQNHGNEKLSKNNTSGYKGVYYSNKYKTWRAQIKHNYKCISLGGFSNKKDAARAYNDAAIKYFGEFVYLNKID